MMKQIAHGVFGWNVDERRSRRYGYFHLLDCPYSQGPEKKVTVPFVKNEIIEEFIGKKVSLHCKVIVTRESEHAGDAFLGILPSTPELGEFIHLGVGVFHTKLDPWTVGATLFSIAPNDGRSKFWLDPNKLYRLHSQTVDLFIENADGIEFSEVPNVQDSEDGIISNGDGTFQIKGDEYINKAEMGNLKIPPRVQKLGPGLFSLDHDYPNKHRII